MSKRPYRRPTAKQIDKNFQPYAAALGAIVYSWNKLHQNLAKIFWNVMGTTNGAIPLAVWHSTQNDRAQRYMLRMAVEAKSKSAFEKFSNPKARDEMIWLLDRTDHLADKRNDAIHSPYLFVIGPGPIRMLPDDLQGHPRAKKFEGKDLLDELKWCHQTSSALSLFAQRLSMSSWNPEIPWPDRPQLPLRPVRN